MNHDSGVEGEAVNGPRPTEGDVNQSERRLQWREKNLDNRTREILDEDAALFLHQSLSTPCLDTVVECEGSWIVDGQGHRILDFHGNSVHQVGYRNPRVMEAVRRQLETLPFAPRRFTHEGAVDLARTLARISPGRLSKVLLVPGGSEAISVALKLIRAATGRFKTVSMWDSFHGATLDAISVGGEALFRQGMGPLLPGAEHVPPPMPPSCPFRCGTECSLQCAQYLDYVLEHEGDVGAVVAETIRCTTVHPPPREYWKQVRESCDRHGALLVLDEITIGLGRTGRMFACEHYDVEPDILVLGKGLGGGVFPQAAVVVREDLDVAGEGALGHFTHEKSPVGSAAALATIACIEEEGLLDRTRELGEYALSRLNELARKHESVHEVRGIGLLLALELRKDGVPLVREAEEVMYRCLERGLSFKVSDGNVLTLVPPLTITRGELEQALEILDRTLSDQACSN